MCDNVVLCSVNQLPIRTYTFQEPVVLACRCFFSFEIHQKSERTPARSTDNTATASGAGGGAPRTPGPPSKGEKRAATATQEMDVDPISSSDRRPSFGSGDGGKTGRKSRKQTTKVAGLCVVLKGSAHIYLDTGVDYTVPLPFSIREVWPLGKNGGLLLQRNIDPAELRASPDEETIPTLYSLYHPLDELKPVAVLATLPPAFPPGGTAGFPPMSPQVFMSPSRKAPSPGTSLAGPSQHTPPPAICKNQTPNIWQHIVAVLPEPSLLVAYDLRDHRHTIWTWVRRPPHIPELVVAAPTPIREDLALPSSSISGTTQAAAITITASTPVPSTPSTPTPLSSSSRQSSKRSGSPAVSPATPLASNKQAPLKATPSFMSPSSSSSSSGANRDAAYHSPPQKDVQKKDLDSEIFLELLWIEPLAADQRLQEVPAHSVFLSHDLDEDSVVCIFKKIEQSLVCLKLSHDPSGLSQCLFPPTLSLSLSLSSIFPFFWGLAVSSSFTLKCESAVSVSATRTGGFRDILVVQDQHLLLHTGKTPLLMFPPTTLKFATTPSSESKLNVTTISSKFREQR